MSHRQGRSQDFWQGSAIWSEARDSAIFARVRRREALPIELRLGSGAQPALGVGDEAVLRKHPENVQDFMLILDPEST